MEVGLTPKLHKNVQQNHIKFNQKIIPKLQFKKINDHMVDLSPSSSLECLQVDKSLGRFSYGWTFTVFYFF